MTDETLMCAAFAESLRCARPHMRVCAKEECDMSMIDVSNLTWIRGQSGAHL